MAPTEKTAKEIIQGLKEEFPGRKIIAVPSEKPEEIICEIEPGKDKSIAIVYIKSSAPHYHNESTEIYIVEEGKIDLMIASEKHILSKGESHTIKSETVHSAVSESWARIKVISTPGWSESDHFLVT